jgi:hypothetical protein
MFVWASVRLCQLDLDISDILILLMYVVCVGSLCWQCCQLYSVRGALCAICSCYAVLRPDLPKCCCVLEEMVRPPAQSLAWSIRHLDDQWRSVCFLANVFTVQLTDCVHACFLRHIFEEAAPLAVPRGVATQDEHLTMSKHHENSLLDSRSADIRTSSISPNGSNKART